MQSIQSDQVPCHPNINFVNLSIRSEQWLRNNLCLCEQQTSFLRTPELWKFNSVLMTSVWKLVYVNRVTVQCVTSSQELLKVCIIIHNIRQICDKLGLTFRLASMRQFRERSNFDLLRLWRCSDPEKIIFEYDCPIYIRPLSEEYKTNTRRLSSCFISETIQCVT